MHKLYSIGILPEPIYKIPPHQHNALEVAYYFEGSGVLKIGEEEIHFQPKDIVFQPPGITHSEQSPGGFRNIHFIMSEFESSGVNILKFKDNESGDVYNILMLIHKEFHLKRKNWEPITNYLLETFCHYLVSFSNERRKNPYVEKCESILIENISDKSFSISSMLKEIPLNDDYIRKLFLKEVGTTPLQYLTEKRINHAKQLLETRYETSAKIKEIADKAGFNDQYYFSRAFKKVTGKSPSEWNA